MTTETIQFKIQKSVVTQCAERERAENTLRYLEKKLLRVGCVGAGLLLLAVHVCVYLSISFASLGFCSA